MKKTRRLLQVGPTCGFYCIAFARRFLTGKHSQRKEIYENIKKAAENNNTYVGEIFDIEQFRQYFGPEFDTEICRIDKIQHFYKKNNSHSVPCVYIVPTLGDKYPHFICLYDNLEEKGMYNPADPADYYMGMQNIVAQNKKIPKIFDWAEYFSHRQKKYLKFFLFPKLYVLTERLFNKHRSNYYRLSSTVNLRGYCIRIQNKAN